MFQIVDIGAIDQSDGETTIFHCSHEVHSADIFGPDKEAGVEIFSNVQFAIVSKFHGKKRARI